MGNHPNFGWAGRCLALLAMPYFGMGVYGQRIRRGSLADAPHFSVTRVAIMVVGWLWGRHRSGVLVASAFLEDEMSDFRSIFRVALADGFINLPDAWLPAPDILYFICGHYPSGDAFAAVYPPSMMTKDFVAALAEKGLKPEPVAVHGGAQIQLPMTVLAILAEQGASVDVALDIALVGQGAFFFVEGWEHVRHWLESSGVRLDD